MENVVIASADKDLVIWLKSPENANCNSCHLLNKGHLHTMFVDNNLHYFWCVKKNNYASQQTPAYSVFSFSF